MLLLGIILVLVPGCIGAMLYPVGRGGNKLIFGWVSGQILLWAGFQLICVPLILVNKSFGQVMQSFVFFAMALLLLSAGVCLRRGCKDRPGAERFKGATRERGKRFYLLWGIFWMLLLLQLFLAVFLAYEEGDDAYYVAISSISVDADNMYMKHPYTGGATDLDVRHALAPFPIWISMLAKLSGMAAVSVAHVALPLVMLPMAYGLYFLLGERLLKERRQQLPYFMILVELLVMFGGYSVYTTENFLLVRSAQGKAVLGNIIIPFLILLLYLLLEHLQEGVRLGIGYWFLMAALMTAGCLCSTLGSFLLCMLVGIVGICAVVCYRKWKFILPLTGCMLSPVCFAVLYFMLG
ncbi:MAG: DUF6077 domain-containing protein [Roseburia sp.]|nr:DUF6077 domain-containing protein [Roseburia sp.]